ncbi:MAG: aldehyde dehydrogenase family protein [Acidimicrobiia bacterium]|nr:aldehyde dehydrogenase family protein [Acidimicrobiia bacterium]
MVGGMSKDDVRAGSDGSVRALPLAGERYTGSESVAVTSPFDGHEIGHIPACGPDDVDRAVRSAKAALAAGPLPRWRRAEILDTAARLLAQRRDQFAEIIAEEAAKPIKTARVEAERAVGTFQFAAAEARTLAGDVVALDAIPSGEGKVGFTMRVPIGVVGAIAPFNFPLNLVAHKLAPAIAAGCPVVLKPASQTPFSGIALAELLIDDCGLPPEWLHVVTGGGSTVGNAIVDHDDIAMITFTGSPEVGWSIRGRAPRKKVGLELGNNAPVIIEADSDWAAAATKIRSAGFSHAGQSCISTQRILVQDAIADSFTEALVKEVSSLVVGDPMDEQTEVSALISESERDRVKEWIDEAVAQGATVAHGGGVDDDGVLGPTVLTGVSPDMKVCSQEVFGPVVAIATYEDLDDALRLANDSRYGLQAAIFTHNVGDAIKAFQTLDFGGVLVNEVPTWRADQQPYGGLRDSGNTREGPAYSVREMTEVRMVILSP